MDCKSKKDYNFSYFCELKILIDKIKNRRKVGKKKK